MREVFAAGGESLRLNLANIAKFSGWGGGVYARIPRTACNAGDVETKGKLGGGGN